MLYERVVALVDLRQYGRNDYKSLHDTHLDEQGDDWVLQAVDVSLGDVEQLAQAFVPNLDHGGHHVWYQFVLDYGILVL